MDSPHHTYNFWGQFVSINKFSGQLDKVRQLCAVFPASCKGVMRGYFSLMNLLSPDSPSVVSKEKWFSSGGWRAQFGHTEFPHVYKSFLSC